MEQRASRFPRRRRKSDASVTDREREDRDISARLNVAEAEIERLRRFRHDSASDRMALVLLKDKVDRLQADFANATTDRGSLRALLDALIADVARLSAKTAEYDKERGKAWDLARPVIIAIVISLVMYVAMVLVRLYPIVGR